MTLIKIFFDILLALVSLIPALPVMIISSIVILIFDRQNPLFFQERIGLNKKVFTIIKLRSMKNGHITKPGRILRKTGIDELPQLFNIIFTDMSFVGPRPITQFDIDRLGWNGNYYASRWQVRPGITGLAQISKSCHKKMSWFLDKKYVQCNNFLLDFKIIFSSFAILFVGKIKVKKWLHPNQ